jgi:hypothetical protein
MNTILTHLSIWFSIESEPLMLAALMCVFGAYVLTQLLKNIALGVFFYPVLLFSSVASIGMATDYGLIGHWNSSIVTLLAAICIGMSLSTVILLTIMAAYNRASS